MKKPDLDLARAAAYKQRVEIQCDIMIALCNDLKADNYAIPATWKGEACNKYKAKKEAGDSEKIANILKTKDTFSNMKATASRFYSEYVAEWAEYERYLQELENQRKAKIASQKRRSGRR